MKQRFLLFAGICFFMVPGQALAQEFISKETLALKLNARVQEISMRTLQALQTQRIGAYTSDSMDRPLDSLGFNPSGPGNELRGLRVYYRKPALNDPTQEYAVSAIAPLVALNYRGIQLPPQPVAFIEYAEFRKFFGADATDLVLTLSNLLLQSSSLIDPVFPMEEYDHYANEEVKLRRMYMQRMAFVNLHSGSIQPMGQILLERVQQVFEEVEAIHTTTHFFKDAALTISIPATEYPLYRGVAEVLYTNPSRTDSVVQINTSWGFGLFGRLVATERSVGLKVNDESGSQVYMDRKEFLGKLEKWEKVLFESVLD